jgi:hypothetical protein
MPAPPEGSEALNVSTMGGEAERSMGMMDARGGTRVEGRGSGGGIATIPILFYRAGAPTRLEGLLG